MTAEGVGIWVAAILTLMVYSFLIADNPLFRLAEHLLVGTALGYAALVVIHLVLLPNMRLATDPSVNSADRFMRIVGLLLGLLLLFWLVRPTRWLASWPLAIVLGVGAALAVGGAVVGTLLPQVWASFLPLRGSSLADNLVIVVIVITGLCYFFFAIRPDRPLGRLLRGAGHVGRWSMMVALGAVLGSRAISLLSAVLERFQFLGLWLRPIINWFKLLVG